MQEMVNMASRAIQDMAWAMGCFGKSINNLNTAFSPYEKEYIEGLRLEYNRYQECLNSPLWR